MKLPPPSGEDRDPKYTVESYRVSNSVRVYVSDGHDYILVHPYFEKYISLKNHWWQSKSPAQRIREALAKAERQARKLNRRELYLKHEARLADRS